MHHAVNMFITVLFAEPLGLSISRFGPAISSRYLLLSPVIKCLYHSNICLAGGLSSNVQNVWKSLAALVNIVSKTGASLSNALAALICRARR